MGKVDPNTALIGITNAVQAFALDIAGAEPAAQSCANIFDADILFALGGGEKDKQGNVVRNSRFHGMTTLEGAKAAHEEGLQGRVYYRFERTKKLARLCAAFHDQEKKVSAEGKKQGSTLNTTEMAIEIARAMTAGEMEQGEAIVRLVCLILKTYIPYKNQAKRVTPLVMVPNSGKTTKVPTADGGRIERGPGCRFVSVNASDETKKHLRL